VVTPHIFNRQGGMAFLEAMIAVAVLSFGLLGVAGLQLAGMKSNQVAYERSVATMHAYGVADQIRGGMASAQYKRPTLGEAKAAAAAWATENVLFPGETVVITQPVNQIIITITWTERCLASETGCSSSGTRSFVTEFLP
jgi:type IV pilus assembly protein PilV